MTAPLFGIVGWKNSGKTTLMAKLIARFASAGLDVAAIKHAHHAFDVDHEGRDSFRYREAGASTVIVSSAARVAIMRELRGAPEPTLAELAQRVQGADFILVEGFKSESHAKLEVRRRESVDTMSLALRDPAILAVAADHDTDAHGRAFFDLNDIDGIAGFIARYCGLSLNEPIAP